MELKDIEQILDKANWYLKGMCEWYNNDDLFNAWFGSCLKIIANELWFDTDKYWTPKK